ncbi:MAG: CbtA family protein [Aeromicrobium sp.]|uniref:CbtA family protein n=1 Tax=Aeromicrobium sp. TaxID=1871063 RepID=UPI0039E6FF93
MTPRNFLIHGMIAGLLAGFVAFIVAFTVGEPPVDDAIAVEEAASAAEEAPAHDHGDEAAEEGHSHGDEEEGITRGQQAGPGLATATLLVGAVLGGVVGVTAAFAAGRLGRLGPVATTATVVGLGFVAYVLAPWLKYPANPPAVGSGESIGTRTALYFSFVVISILAMVAAVLVARTVLATAGAWAAVTAGVVLYVAVIAVTAWLMEPMPSIAESLVEKEFPAKVLADFRAASLVTQGALWLTLGVALTGLVDRSAKREAVETARREAAAAL